MRSQLANSVRFAAPPSVPLALEPHDVHTFAIQVEHTDVSGENEKKVFVQILFYNECCYLFEMLLTIICEMVWGMDVLDAVSEVTLLVTWSAPLCLRPVTSLVRWTTSPPPASPLAIRAVLPTNAPLYVGETFELVNFLFLLLLFS